MALRFAPSFRSSEDRSAEAGFVFRSELPVTARRTLGPRVTGGTFETETVTPVGTDDTL